MEADSPAPAGTVLRSAPAAGTAVNASDAVALVVASGRTAVPDVVGRPWADGRAALVAAGLVVEELPDGAGTHDPVAHRTEPAAGTRVPVGSTVAVRTGPRAGSGAGPTAAPAPVATGTPAPAGSPGPGSGATPSPTPGTP
ncbi:PASTA domain-containing protein [Cellulomonas soli]